MLIPENVFCEKYVGSRIKHSFSILTLKETRCFGSLNKCHVNLELHALSVILQSTNGLFNFYDFCDSVPSCYLFVKTTVAASSNRLSWLVRNKIDHKSTNTEKERFRDI